MGVGVRGRALSWRAGVSLLVVSLVVGACAGAPGEAAETVPAPSGGSLRHPDYTYQPDVVFVGSAGEAVLGATADGMVWTVDGDAPGAGDLDLGVVMYASNLAVGRVVLITPVGDDLAVTLAPVELTEILRDAEIVVDTAIDASAVRFQEIPELPGSVPVPLETGPIGDIADGRAPSAPPTGEAAAPPPDGGPGRSLTVGAVGAASPAQPSTRKPLPPEVRSSAKVSVGNYEVEPSMSADRIGLRIGYKALSSEQDPDAFESQTSLKIFVDIGLKTKDLRVRSRVSIAGGALSSEPTMVLEGITGITLDIAAGSAEPGSAVKGNFRVEVPTEITIPVPDVPLVMRFRWTFGIRFAPGGKNSTLTAAGEWALKGLAGLENGALAVPELTTEKSIIDSVMGLSIGVAAVIVSAELRVQLGVGIPAASVGPYSRLVLSVGVVNGSSISATYARCVSASLDIWLGGGIGLTVKSEAWAAIKKLLPPKTKLDVTFVEGLVNVIHREQTVPDVPLCVGEA